MRVNEKHESIMVFSFLPNNVVFIKKNAIFCSFLKNVSPSKRVVGFILNNLHLPKVEGIAFHALYKTRVLIMSCKAILQQEDRQVAWPEIKKLQCRRVQMHISVNITILFTHKSEVILVRNMCEIYFEADRNMRACGGLPAFSKVSVSQVFKK